MRIFLLGLVLIGSAMAADTKEKAKEELVLPIPAMTLTNGKTWKNVTVVRYEKENVVLKSSAGIGPLPYSYVPEPTRGLMLAARDAALAARDQTQQATATAENKARNAAAVNAEAAHAAKEEWHRRVRAAIHDGDLLIGMSSEEVKQSIGGPQRTNRSGDFDQWIYPTSYVYFKDGKLISRENRN